jgi:hypothetical protein
VITTSKQWDFRRIDLYRSRENILSVDMHPNVKKGLLLIVLLGLFCVGTALLEGFLPYKWRHAIDQRVDLIFPSPTYVPHPDIDWEFELDFLQHPWHRSIDHMFLGVLIIGDAYLILIVWRACRRLNTST